MFDPFCKGGHRVVLNFSGIPVVPMKGAAMAERDKSEVLALRLLPSAASVHWHSRPLPGSTTNNPKAMS